MSCYELIFLRKMLLFRGGGEEEERGREYSEDTSTCLISAKCRSVPFLTDRFLFSVPGDYRGNHDGLTRQLIFIPEVLEMKLSSSNMRPTANGWSLRQRSDLSSSARISAGRCSESIGQGKGYERLLCIYEDLVESYCCRNDS